MTKYPDLFAALAAPFGKGELKTRALSEKSSKQLTYVTARTVMNRLDDVVGPENWWDAYRPDENSVLCELTIRLPDGQTLTKCDAGGYAGMADDGDDSKSGYSDAFKRAAVKFGVARYLYNDGTPAFVAETTPPATNGHDKMVANGGDLRHTPADQVEPRWGNGQAGDKTPRSGKALYGWVLDQEQRHAVGLLKYLNGWAKLQEFPARMVDWDTDQVKLAHAEALRKLSMSARQQPAGVAG